MKDERIMFAEDWKKSLFLYAILETRFGYRFILRLTWVEVIKSRFDKNQIIPSVNVTTVLEESISDFCFDYVYHIYSALEL